MNYAGWVDQGSIERTEFTRRFESVAAGPLLAEGVGDTWDTLVLDKVPPCPLHIGLLFANDPLNHLERGCWPEVKAVLKDLFGIQPHSYQGFERNYQGPEIRKVLNGLHKLYPLMRPDPIKSLYLDVFIQLRNVNTAIFGLQLQPNWKQCLDQLRCVLLALNAATSFPITPKAHILMEHVGQWVERHGRALGKEGEQAGESLHHFWKRSLESQGEVKDKQSQAFETNILRVLVKFNSDNV